MHYWYDTPMPRRKREDAYIQQIKNKPCGLSVKRPLSHRETMRIVQYNKTKVLGVNTYHRLGIGNPKGTICSSSPIGRRHLTQDQDSMGSNPFWSTWFFINQKRKTGKGRRLEISRLSVLRHMRLGQVVRKFRIAISGSVAQQRRAPACHAGGRGFESHRGRLQKGE